MVTLGILISLGQLLWYALTIMRLTIFDKPTHNCYSAEENRRFRQVLRKEKADLNWKRSATRQTKGVQHRWQ